MADMDFPAQVGSRGAGTCNKVNATSTEAARRLLGAYKQLEFTQPPPVGGIDAATTMEQQELWARVELRPAACQRRVKTFLSEIESTAQALELPMASRRYRQGFTRNYRALMPADRRVYRVDVLEAGQEAHNVLWVNGIRYVLPDKVLAANLKFRTAWTTLLREISLLNFEYSAASTDDNVMSSLPNASRKFDWLTRLGFPLIRFDFCWTEFERNYIEALMAIEQEARSTLMDCLYVDEELRQYEKLYYRIASSKTHGGGEADDVDASLVNLSSTICDCYTRLIYHVGQLNSCANTRRKGRSDFRFSVIDTATRAVCLTESVTKAELDDDASEQASFYAPFSHRYPWATYRCTDHTDHWIYTAEPDEVETLRPLAEPLIRDIEALRNVFASLAQSPERIDPHLAQNASLAEALAQFESRWDDVSVYLDKPCVLRSLTTFLAFLQLVLRLDRDNYGPKSRDNLKHTSGNTKNASPRAKEKQFLKQGKTDVTRLTLEDRIACLDVSAFLALSRLAVLFSVLSSSYVAEDKRAEFPHASLLKHLLPDTFEALMHDAQFSANADGNCLIERSGRECCAALKSSNPETASLPPYSPWLFPMARPLEVESQEGAVEVVSYFVARTPVTQDIPPALDNVVYWGSRFSSFFTQSHIDPVLAAKAQTRALLHIFERCVKQGDEADGDSDEQYVTKLPPTGGLDETVQRFVHALKESSMTLQRTNPKEWNAFIQTSLKCLQSFRLVCPFYNLQRSHSKTLYTTSTSTSASSPRFNVEEEVCSPRVSFHPPLAAATAASAPETPRSSVQPQTKLPWCMLEGSPAPPSAAFNRPPSNPFYFTPSASRNIPRTSS